MRFKKVKYSKVGNQKPWIEERQTTQKSRENEQRQTTQTNKRINNDLQNTTGTQKTKDWTMIYKILLVHSKLNIEQWSTKYYWYTVN
jgi:hypothetical protein